MEDNELPSLPLSPERQRAAMGYLLTRENFFLQCKDRIQPSWFVDPIVQSLYKTLISWHKDYHKFPTPEDLFEHPEIQSESQQRRNLIKTQISVCIHSTSVYAIEAIQAELTEWLHSRIFIDGIYKAGQLFNRKQAAEAYRTLDSTNRTIRETSFAQERVYRFGDIEAIFAKRESNVDGALTWGLSTFDRLLLPEGDGKGCLLPGTSTVLVGPVNSGKTSTMLTVACANIKRGKKVLYIPHEGSPEELQVKWLCTMAGKTIPWWKEWRYVLLKQDLNEKEQDVANFIRRHQQKLDENLTFMPMIRQGLCVEEVMSTIRRKWDDILTKEGRGFDLVLDDYPAKLNTEEAKGGKMEHRHKLETIYMAFNRLSEELGFHSLTGAQTNREGSKINKGMSGSEKRLLEMEDFAEAFGPMADAATVITINRDEEAEKQNRVAFHCAKSRTSDKGWTVVARSAYSEGRSHWESLGSCWYKGSVKPGERMKDFLENYRNQQITVDDKNW